MPTKHDIFISLALNVVNQHSFAELFICENYHRRLSIDFSFKHYD